jgi:lipopolysaccharide-assembly LptC-related protein
MVVVTAATGIYQTQSRLLDLFGDVTLTHANGTRFVTQAAHLDLATETAGGHDPVAGRGPSGDITAEGFRILDQGDTIVFSGRSHLLLERISARRAAPPSPALPAEVEQAAARIAAAATATRATGAIVAPGPHTGPHMGPHSGPHAAANERRQPPRLGPAARHNRQAPGAAVSEIRPHAG